MNENDVNMGRAIQIANEAPINGEYDRDHVLHWLIRAVYFLLARYIQSN